MKLFIFTIIIICFSCSEQREIKYSGFDDLFLGVHDIKLFNNGEFSLELSVGAREGVYKTHSDTVYLNYYDSTDNWPEKALIMEKKFIMLNGKNSDNKTTITRYK